MQSTNREFNRISLREAAGLIPMALQSLGGLTVAEYYRNKTKREMMDLMRDKVVPGTVAAAGAVAGLSSFAGGLGALAVWSTRKKINRAAKEIHRGATRGLRKARTFVKRKIDRWRGVRESEPRVYSPFSKWLNRMGDESIHDWIDSKSNTLGGIYHALVGGGAKKKYTGLPGILRSIVGKNPIVRQESPGGLLNLGKHMVKEHPLVSALGTAYAIGNVRNMGRMMKTGARNLKGHLKRTYREFKARTTAPVKKAAEVVGGYA